jgi:hypothetical protein
MGCLHDSRVARCTPPPFFSLAFFLLFLAPGHTMMHHRTPAPHHPPQCPPQCPMPPQHLLHCSPQCPTPPKCTSTHHCTPPTFSTHHGSLLLSTGHQNDDDGNSKAMSRKRVTRYAPCFFFFSFAHHTHHGTHHGTPATVPTMPLRCPPHLPWCPPRLPHHPHHPTVHTVMPPLPFIISHFLCVTTIVRRKLVVGTCLYI